MRCLHGKLVVGELFNRSEAPLETDSFIGELNSLDSSFITVIVHYIFSLDNSQETFTTL